VPLNITLKNEKMYDAVWTITDILIVILFIYGCSMAYTFILLAIFGDSTIASRFSRYGFHLLGILSPIFWIKKKYRLPKEVLGLQKSNLGSTTFLLTGIILAMIFTIFAKLHLFNYVSMPINQRHFYTYIDYILLPLSFGGFATIVLAPISEEIMIRGFVYGYLRNKLGVSVGLFLQALMFSLLHFKSNIYEISYMLILGLIFGFLYEKAGSLYPSMIFHGAFNFLAFLNIG